MRQLIRGFILISLFVCITGCKTTGYTVRIETDLFEYNELFRIETILTNKGYDVVGREKIRYEGAAPNDVTTSLEKNFSREKIIHGADPTDIRIYFEKRYNEERYWWVSVDISYVKDMSNNKLKKM